MGALLSLEQSSLRVSRLHELNDPFEWRIGISDLIDGVEHIAEAASELALRDLSNSIGLICFSAVPDEPVLWSHYADRHRGIVLELEFPDDGKTCPIGYTDERPHVRAGLIDNPEHMRPEIERMIRQKSTGWSYEQEFRRYQSLADCVARGGHYYTPLKNEELKRVIIGWRSAIDIDYVRRILTTANFTGAEVVRASIQNETYKLKCS